MLLNNTRRVLLINSKVACTYCDNIIDLESVIDMIDNAEALIECPHCNKYLMLVVSVSRIFTTEPLI